VAVNKYATFAQYLFTLFMYFLGAILLTVAVIPPIYLTFCLWQAIDPSSLFAKTLILASGLGFGYFLFGLTLVFATVLLRLILNLKLEEGEYPFFSLAGFKWAFVNAMMLIVNLTFMDFMRLTPLLPLYYKLMGAKIGRRVQINTKGLADVSLIEIGDDTVLGGDAVLIGHLAEHGKLKLKKTAIGKKVTIGLGAVVMPGASIGDGALIAARSVLPKNTVVPTRALFAGTPAKFVRNLDDKVTA
jgi:hypothetical protein